MSVGKLLYKTNHDIRKLKTTTRKKIVKRQWSVNYLRRKVLEYKCTAEFFYTI